ncbi:Hypothetical predicted protein [Lecanosticta acicola]|uniref:Uncharacterized protein n=1 Tax=Lecanosticta acicola TaxID=111012 RepID=A0AAI9EFF5_9PEZI|nr:Hypothetical predicted protein [Lecanosticta acicola]
MYFAENRFRLIFEDYDSSVYTALLKVLKSHGIEMREHVKVSIRGDPNWDNLSRWLYLLSTHKCKAPERYEDYGQMEYDSYDKLQMVFHCAQKGWRDMDWRAFQFPLQLFRIILASSDRRWLPADQTFRDARDLFIRTDLTAGLENMREQIDRADPRIHRYRPRNME